MPGISTTQLVWEPYLYEKVMDECLHTDHKTSCPSLIFSVGSTLPTPSPLPPLPPPISADTNSLHRLVAPWPCRYQTLYIDWLPPDPRHCRYQTLYIDWLPPDPWHCRYQTLYIDWLTPDPWHCRYQTLYIDWLPPNPADTRLST